jgi:hypothetical protein
MLAGCMLMSMPPLVWHACASMQPHACPPPMRTRMDNIMRTLWTRNRRLFSRRGCMRTFARWRPWVDGGCKGSDVCFVQLVLAWYLNRAGVHLCGGLFGPSQFRRRPVWPSQFRRPALRPRVPPPCDAPRDALCVGFAKFGGMPRGARHMHSHEVRARSHVARRWYLRRCLLRSCAAAEH